VDCLVPHFPHRTTIISVRYGAGRGRFSIARPRPAPAQRPPPLIPWTGPCLLPPIFRGDSSVVWVGWGAARGQGQGMPKKTPRPRLLSMAGRCKGPGAHVSRGPVRPVTNSNHYGLGCYVSQPKEPFSYLGYSLLGSY